MTPYFNKYVGTDVLPYQTMARVSDKIMVIRPMKAELDPSFRPEIVTGGFVGHCTNNNKQVWTIYPDPEAPTIRVSLHKDGWWRDRAGNRYQAADEPVRFYDYNF